jgi:hypothetical protein
MNMEKHIRHFWELFEVHQLHLRQGEAADPQRYRAALEQLGLALGPLGEDLRVACLQIEGRTALHIQNFGRPSEDAISEAIVTAGPEDAHWQFCWERSWMPEDGFAFPTPPAGPGTDPMGLEHARVLFDVVRTVEGEVGFRLRFFMKAEDLHYAEEVKSLLPLLAGGEGYPLIRRVHFEALGAETLEEGYPFRPVLQWTRWIHPGYLRLNEPLLLGPEE